MSTQTLISDFEKLPPELQKELEIYLQRLVAKSEKQPKRRGGYGSLKGLIKMKDDFDAPIPGFESYTK
jgi:hypothetical protein